MIYLDNAATTMVCPEAVQAALEAMTQCCGNPSSTHRMGREAHKVLNDSRKTVAEALGCDPEELFFTSGGTESDNWAILRGAESQRGRRHLISSQTEHDAVRQTMRAMADRGWEVSFLAPEKDGSVSAGAVTRALREDTALVSLMLVNNETGAVSDIAAIAAAVRKAGSQALIHTDAVQGFGKLPFTVKELGVDLLSVSAHKLHAPKGLGALYIRKGVKLKPLLWGGGQEEGMRSGTEPMPQIAAFAAAIKAAREAAPEAIPRMKQLRRLAGERLRDECGAVLLCPEGAAHILSFSLPGHRSEVLLNFLEGRDICVSKSSACKKGRRSHVLEAMKLKNELIDGALRVSFSRFTTEEEVTALCDALAQASRSLRTSLR